MSVKTEVVVGTLIYRQGAYILDKFLENQKQIQNNYPASELALATNEIDFIPDLEHAINRYGIKGSVVAYKTVKPEYARNSVWNIACGREALRSYVQSRNDVQYFLSLDADMIYDAEIIRIFKEKIHGYDVVYSGCFIKGFGMGLCGAGCMMMSRNILEKIRFRCIEFKNGEVIFEDNLLEMDLFKMRAKVNKGFFLDCSHYRSETEYRHIAPRSVGVFRRLTTAALIRYLLIDASIVVSRNIPWRVKIFVDRLRGETW